MNKPKQVILARTDLGMGAGKMGSQIAHATLKVFFDRASTVRHEDGSGVMTIPMTKEMMDWAEGEFTKIVLEIKSEEQLRKKYQLAIDAGLPASFIIDNGHTVFNGIKTPTTCAIGPADPEAIDAITKDEATGKLKLLK
jgi:PTH2 family peptidyl-tRNA hydrolase